MAESTAIDIIRKTGVFPVLAGVILPGGGHFLMERPSLGVLYLLLAVPGYFMLILPGLVIHLVSVLHIAYIVAMERQCPLCKEWVRKDAIRCKHCHADVTTAPP